MASGCGPGARWSSCSAASRTSPPRSTPTTPPPAGWRPSTCMECGLRSFGFFAFGEAWWIAMYREGFQGTLRTAPLRLRRLPTAAIQSPLLPKWRDSMQSAGGEVAEIAAEAGAAISPSPDYAAARLNICRSEEIAVPEQIAVISGVNDPPLCNVFTPPLTCVEHAGGTHRLRGGRHAGAVMAGEKPPEHTFWIPATHVVRRQSSDLVAIEDADMAVPCDSSANGRARGSAFRRSLSPWASRGGCWSGSSGNIPGAPPRMRS